MASGLTTIADVVALKDADSADMHIECLEMFPLLMRLRAQPVSGTTYKTPVMLTAPRGEFRAENTGKSDAKGTFTLRTATMDFYDASWRIDKQVASSDTLGTAHALAVTAKAAMLGCYEGLEHQLFYGDATADGFDGLLKILKAAGRATDLEGTGTDLSSVILMHDSNFALLFGNDAALFSPSPVTFGAIADTNGKEFYGWRQNRDGYVGVDATDYSSAYVIHGFNTGESAAVTLDDDVILSAESKFKTAKKPNIVAMNSTALEQIRKSRTATNPTGAPALAPDMIGGMKVVVVDTLHNEETDV